ncbi:MAG: response regulator, partial [Microcoleus sp. SIO2G3]|nr:response regulator [Microcoleus sp. SIO2G3]
MSVTVLVVDDEAAVRLLLARLLQRQAYTVTEAENGDRAWQLLQTASFDLVLLDILMPGLSGTELLARMKANP